MGDISKEILACLDDYSNDQNAAANREYADQKAAQLVEELNSHEIESELVDQFVSYNSTSFVLHIFGNVSFSQLKRLEATLQMHLSVRRLEIIQLPDNDFTVLVIVDNPVRTVFSLRDAVTSPSDSEENNPLLFFLGADATGLVVTDSINELSPVFVGGATGSGKSLFIHSLICTLLLLSDPEEVKLILADTKKIEFSSYQDVPHLLSPVMKSSEHVLMGMEFLAKIIDERIDLFAGQQCKNIKAYNAAVPEINKKNDHSLKLKKLPYIVMVFDDITETLIEKGEAFEKLYLNLINRASIAGVYFVLCAQLPSAAVIPKTIMRTMNSRIAFAMASQKDSVTVLETSGAEDLQDNGELLYRNFLTDDFLRLQGIYVSENEIYRISEYAKGLGKPNYDDIFVAADAFFDIGSGRADPLYSEIKESIFEMQKVSTSLIQRQFGIGYNRARRIVDALEADGVIEFAAGEYTGSVLIADPENKPDLKDDIVENGAIEKSNTDIDYSMTLKLFDTNQIEMNDGEETELKMPFEHKADKTEKNKKNNIIIYIIDWILIMILSISSVFSVLKADGTLWDILIIFFSFITMALLAPFLRRRVLRSIKNDSLRRGIVLLNLIIIMIGWLTKLI